MKHLLECIALLSVAVIMIGGWLLRANRCFSEAYKVSFYGTSIGAPANELSSSAGTNVKSYVAEDGRTVLYKQGRFEAWIQQDKIDLIISDEMYLTSSRGLIKVTLGDKIAPLRKSLGKPHSLDKRFFPDFGGEVEIFRYKCFDSELDIFVDKSQVITKLVASEL